MRCRVASRRYRPYRLVAVFIYSPTARQSDVRPPGDAFGPRNAPAKNKLPELSPNSRPEVNNLIPFRTAGISFAGAIALMAASVRMNDTSASLEKGIPFRLEYCSGIPQGHVKFVYALVIPEWKITLSWKNSKSQIFSRPPPISRPHRVNRVTQTGDHHLIQADHSRAKPFLGHPRRPWPRGVHGPEPRPPFPGAPSGHSDSRHHTPIATVAAIPNTQYPLAVAT